MLIYLMQCMPVACLSKNMNLPGRLWTLPGYAHYLCQCHLALCQVRPGHRPPAFSISLTSRKGWQDTARPAGDQELRSRHQESRHSQRCRTQERLLGGRTDADIGSSRLPLGLLAAPSTDELDTSKSLPAGSERWPAVQKVLTIARSINKAWPIPCCVLLPLWFHDINNLVRALGTMRFRVRTAAGQTLRVEVGDTSDLPGLCEAVRAQLVSGAEQLELGLNKKVCKG